MWCRAIEFMAHNLQLTVTAVPLGWLSRAFRLRALSQSDKIALEKGRRLPSLLSSSAPTSCLGSRCRLSAHLLHHLPHGGDMAWVAAL